LTERKSERRRRKKKEKKERKKEKDEAIFDKSLVSRTLFLRDMVAEKKSICH
jgi:hypothetical protein